MNNILTKIANNKKANKPVIYGVEGHKLTDWEKYFLSKNGAVGIIIFARNIANPEQLSSLTKEIFEIMEGEILILIDQEGGRVARMKPPFWPEYPAAGHFAELYQNNPQNAKEQIFDNFKKISQDLQKMFINVNCVPLLDIVNKETSEIIGNRSLGNNIDSIIDLAQEICKSSLENNIYPVIKHIPGHGRAKSDSHLELPVVDASFLELANSDFLPFIALRDQKFAMTAHILFSAIDDKLCATISPKIIDIIRNFIGFKNILMTDDLSMKALTGSFEERTKASLKAGCDLILHCNGNQAEMLEIASSLPVINDDLLIKFSNP